MIRKTLLAAAIAGFALQAQAAPVTVNFTGDGFDGGVLAGQTLSGQFVYNDAGLTTTTGWLAISSFSFMLDGQTYALTATELDDAVATFADGLLTGVAAVAFDNGASGAFDFTFTDGFGAPYAYYEGHDSRDGFGFANLSFSTAAAATVPEPASYALVLAALGGGLFARRRRQA